MIKAHAFAGHVHDVECLAADLAELGVTAGGNLLIHASMRHIGWIGGGAQTLATAIRKVAGEDCTIVVPTHTTINSPTSRAFRAATTGMTRRQKRKFVKRLPGFSPTSPAVRMGMFADHVLACDNVVRSAHPLVSFAAVGPQAEQLMKTHLLESHLGEESPLGSLYTDGASILLLGVGYEACSALHLAEYRLDDPPPTRPYTCVVSESDRRVVKRFKGFQLDDSDFEELGRAFEAKVNVPFATVGYAPARWFSIGDAVDFAVKWMNVHRRRS